MVEWIGVGLTAVTILAAFVGLTFEHRLGRRAAFVEQFYALRQELPSPYATAPQSPTIAQWWRWELKLRELVVLAPGRTLACSTDELSETLHMSIDLAQKLESGHQEIARLEEEQQRLQNIASNKSKLSTEGLQAAYLGGVIMRSQQQSSLTRDQLNNMTELTSQSLDKFGVAIEEILRRSEWTEFLNDFFSWIFRRGCAPTRFGTSS